MIDTVQARIALEADLERISDVIQKDGWVIDPWPLESETFFVAMRSGIDKESYTMRLICNGYPDEPPSIACIDPSTRSPNALRAWPQCEGFRPPPTADLCLNISREGLKQLHPDWAKDARYAWNSSGNPIQMVLDGLQDRLNDRSKYRGRCQ